MLRDPAVHVLRRGLELAAMTPEVRRFFFAPQPIIITKSSVVSRVHRRVHMDYIGLKTYGADGASSRATIRIVGLFYVARPTPSRRSRSRSCAKGGPGRAPVGLPARKP